jgi:glutamine synthetase
MPKPFRELTGNGCHVHVSLWSGETNAFAGDDADGLSETARHFLGGLLAHAPALAAITNPTVNSYKRINAPRTLSGATWSPNTITWSGNNRTHMVRVPDGGRFELRLADGAANPYLLQAAVIAAGLDGIATRADPGARLDVDMYREAARFPDVPRLPGSLLDALRAFDQDETLKAALGEEFSASYLRLRQADWDAYAGQITDWERLHTLDV